MAMEPREMMLDVMDEYKRLVRSDKFCSEAEAAALLVLATALQEATATMQSGFESVVAELESLEKAVKSSKLLKETGDGTE